MTTIKQLRVLLCNHIEASLAVKTYHWNIEGPHFNEYHDFFGAVYTEYDAQIDTLAEFIRILSGAKEYVNILSQDVHNNKTIDPDLIVGSDVSEMITQIELVNDALISGFNVLLVKSNEEQEHGLANYCGDRLEALSKLGWKLKAMSK